MSVYEKIDKIGALIEQMSLAHRMKDDTNFSVFKKEASSLCFVTLRQMEEQGLDD